MAKDREGFLKAAYDLESEEQRQDLYRAWAKTYDQELLETYDYVAPIRTAEMFREYQPGTDIDILEVGVGTGLAGLALRDMGYGRIDGVDVVQEMLDEAAKKGVYRSLTVADIRKPLDFPAQHFDAVISVGTFSINEIAPDHLSGLIDVTKPGGLICFTVNEMVFETRNYRGYFDLMTAEERIAVVEVRYEDYIKATETRAFICLLRVL